MIIIFVHSFHFFCPNYKVENSCIMYILLYCFVTLTRNLSENLIIFLKRITDHPRFGRIPSLKTIKAVKKGEELFSHYKVSKVSFWSLVVCMYICSLCPKWSFTWMFKHFDRRAAATFPLLYSSFAQCSIFN